MADCVFRLSFAGEEGTVTNIEHRIQRLNRGIQPLVESRPDWSIFEEVAKAMGHPMGYFTAANIPGMSERCPFTKA